MSQILAKVVASTDSSTICSICQLWRPPWPILTDVDTLFREELSSCPGCALLRTVLNHYVKKSQYKSHKAISIAVIKSELSVKLQTIHSWRPPLNLQVNALEGMFVCEAFETSPHLIDSLTRVTMPLARNTEMS
jgi:hypothetical protein